MGLEALNFEHSLAPTQNCADAKFALIERQSLHKCYYYDKLKKFIEVLNA